MGQLSTYKLEGQPRTPFREAKNIRIQAVFGAENTADLSLDEVTFTNNNDHLDRDFLYSKFLSNPLEGVTCSVGITDNITGTPYAFDFDFFTDWKTLQLKAVNELSVGLRNLNSIRGFDERSKSITWALLEYKNVIQQGDYSPLPYIVENRKTFLEKVQLLVQSWTITKTIFDEIHKFINIASDLTTLGVVQATLNLTLTIANLIALVQKLVQLLKDIREAFFPPVRYHSGNKPMMFIQKGAEYLGYDAVDFGTGLAKLENTYWCPSKNDEEGDLNSTNTGSGAMKPADYGYTLFETVNYFEEFWNWKKAIIDNVLHLRPKDDPFWVQIATSPPPDVLVEDSEIYSNGIKRPNLDEFVSNTILQYSTDDSDLHTLRDLADPSDPNSAEKIISGVIVEPDSVTDQRRVINGQGKAVDIPHALCVRKDTLDDLFDLFLTVGGLSNSIKDEVKAQFDTVASIIGQSFPQLESFITSFGGRDGCMVIENDYFSTPKVLYAVPTDVGLGQPLRIPTDFADQIGAKALMEYHKYDSFVPGVRNPSNPNDTNSKFLFEGVDIQMNVKKFTLLLNNPYFSVSGGLVGKYTSIDWDVENDRATIEYWIQDPWMQNVTETTI